MIPIKVVLIVSSDYANHDNALFFITTSDGRRIRNKNLQKKGNEKRQTRNAFIFSHPIPPAMTTRTVYDLPYITQDRFFIIMIRVRWFLRVFGIILLRSVQKWLHSSSSCKHNTRSIFFKNNGLDNFDKAYFTYQNFWFLYNY